PNVAGSAKKLNSLATRLNPLQARGEEAVEPGQARGGVGPAGGQGAEVSGGRDEVSYPADIVRRNRSAADLRAVRQKRLDGMFAFLGFERAGAVHDGAARPGQGNRTLEQAALQGGQRREIGGALEPGDVGV